MKYALSEEEVVFEAAVVIASECANERILCQDSREANIDCDFCPCAEECREFWDTHVCNHIYSIAVISRKFEEFKRRKRK